MENMEVISSYSDEEAVADGILADITNWALMLNGRLIDRITSNLLAQLGQFETSTIELKRIINHKITQATGDRDFMKLPPNLWATINERGNYTLMLPEDY